MRFRRRDISEREQEAALKAMNGGQEPVLILRSKLDEAIAVRLRIQHRLNAVLMISLVALAAALWGLVGLANQVNRNNDLIRANKARIATAEYAYCALKVGLTSFSENGSLLFASVLHVPPAAIKAKVQPALRLVQAIPSSHGCEKR